MPYIFLARRKINFSSHMIIKLYYKKPINRSDCYNRFLIHQILLHLMKTFDQTSLMFVATFLVVVILPNMVWTQTTQGIFIRIFFNFTSMKRHLSYENFFLANLTCYFPFNYNGKNYTTCTTSGYGFPWCSPTPIFSGKIINCTANISQPCLNNGTYILTSMGLFTCRCSPSYTGTYFKIYHHYN